MLQFFKGYFVRSLVCSMNIEFVQILTNDQVLNFCLCSYLQTPNFDLTKDFGPQILARTPPYCKYLLGGGGGTLVLFVVRGRAIF